MTGPRDLEAFARARGLEFDIVQAKLPNAAMEEEPRFYLVAEDGRLLYEPRDIGGTVEAARGYIGLRAAQADILRSELARPYYGGWR